MKKFILFFTFAVFAFTPCSAQQADGEERILNFVSTVTVQEDASAIVREEITLNAQHKEIRRGIVRAIPSSFRQSVKPLSLQKGGAPYPYFSYQAGRNIEINFGNNEFLRKGYHTFVLTYKMNNVVGFFKDYDEIYWNVTGNDWVFPIERAAVTIILPEGANAIGEKISTYTGPRGTTTTTAVQTGPLSFETSATLYPGAGFTIAVPWQKGVIETPRTAESAAGGRAAFAPPPLSQQEDSVKKPLLISVRTVGAYQLLLLISLIIYCALTRKKIIRDNDDPIAAEYKPPKDISPAFMRAISDKFAGRRDFAAAIVNLAMKGSLAITREKSFLSTKTFLNKVEGSAYEPAKEERIIIDTLLSEGSFELSSKNRSSLKETILLVQKKLTEDLKPYIMDNEKYRTIPSIIIALMFLPTVLIMFVYPENAPQVFMLTFVMMFVSFAVCWILIGTGNINAYSELGRPLANHIKGFKRYMSVAEEGRIALSDPLDAERIFADYLPYAFALGITNVWFKKFEGIISAAEIEKVAAQAGGTDFMRGAALMGEINSAMPSSSGGSGSGGGGFSGGGSGGGGGWGR